MISYHIILYVCIIHRIRTHSPVHACLSSIYTGENAHWKLCTRPPANIKLHVSDVAPHCACALVVTHTNTQLYHNTQNKTKTELAKCIFLTSHR